MSLPDRICEAIERHELVPPGANVLVACSAGPDSTALLAALAELVAGDRLAATLACAHLDHGLRPGSARDADAARALAAHLDIPFFMERVNLASDRGSIEARARTARYDFLARTAARGRFACVATGHTRGDQVETVLLARLRGAPARALGGMAFSRPLSPGQCKARLIRPMLDASRADVTRYLASRGLAGRLDPTNLDTRLRRNWVRRELLPRMRETDPEIDSLLLCLGERARADEARLGALAAARLAAASIKEGEAFLPEAVFAGARPALVEAVLSRTLRRSGLGAHLGRRGLANVRSLLRGRCGRAFALGGAVEAERVRGGITLSRRVPPCVGEGYLRRLDVPGEARVPGGRLRAQVLPGAPNPADLDPGREAVLDLDRLEMPLEVRPRRPGDRMRPLGAPGSRKIKKIMSERGVRRLARGTLPLVVSAGRVVWIAGLVVAHEARLTPGTQRALHLAYERG